MENRSSYPEAQEPIYEVSSTNEPIGLFSGELLLSRPNKTFPARSGTVEWHWLPKPRIRFDLAEVDTPPDLSEGELIIAKHGLSCDVLITSINLAMASGLHACQGLLLAPVILGDSVCDRVVFHLPNFKRFLGNVITDSDGGRMWAGRLPLQSNEWKVTIDENMNCRELVKSLKNEGGFGLTHTGSAERADGKPFEAEQADSLLNALFYFLSFTRGFWCGPVLSVGQLNGKNVWYQWKLPKTLTPWSSVKLWFPYDDKQGIGKVSKAFSGFMEKWGDALWGDPIKLAVHWYVESNLNAGGVEGSIILAQAALEMLGWVYLVEDKSTRAFSSTKFDGLSASGRIRWLLDKLQIPVDIPRSLNELTGQAASLGASDGPDVFVKLRNAIVHPKRTKRNLFLQVSTQTRVEAWQLGLWYLELSLLHLLGYNGVYYDRFVSGYPGDARTDVPWVSSKASL